MAKAQFHIAGGQLSVPADLSFPKAADLALRLAAGEIPYADLVECRRQGTEETVVFNVQVEVPTRRAHQVQRRERIAATFHQTDSSVPRVEALREDFPVVPHLNLNQQEFPRSLCLYEEPYSELKRRWTSARFVHRIREWLELTAKDELHPEDQSLEPLLVDFVGNIVLPHDIDSIGGKPLFVSGIEPKDGSKWFHQVHRNPPKRQQDALPIVVSVHSCEPRTHGVIQRSPASLEDVAKMTQTAGLDLVAELRDALPSLRETAIDSRVIVVVSFPKTRTDGSPVETPDLWCFATAKTVGELCISLGLWSEAGGTVGRLLEVDAEKRGQDVQVVVLNPCVELTRDAAAKMNGMENASDLRIVGIGAGALGSQVVLNLVRAGFGHWTLIDQDRLMPHNLARHALGGDFVGFSKAEALAHVAGTTTCEEGILAGLNSEFQANGANIKEALSSSDVIIDMTASVAAQRYVARDLGSMARRLCTFLTPSGSDLVLLSENSGRQVTLDALEMQYYRALLRDVELDGHLQLSGEAQRYARSCGDKSSAMPQDLVALHSAIASRNIKEVLAGDDSFIGVWRADASSNVRHISVPVRPVTEFDLGTWTIVLDDGLRERLNGSREEKLPNETGGVLLGSFDLERSILYIVDTLPSPSDSEEKADLYIRGCNGLRKAVDGAGTKTGGMLEYIGEWHSHPRGSSTRPSDFDLAAFVWLTGLMSLDGLPAVMMIAGDDELSLFVGSMGTDASPIPEAASA